MQPLYPLTFNPSDLTRDYLWGGSKLKPLVPDYPVDQPLAELWIVSDRPEENVIGTITNGPLAGTTLRQLMIDRPGDIVGRIPTVQGKFPLLIKLMDPKLRLSLQVHPPAVVATKLDGEPKMECWTFLDGTEPSARVFVGIKQGVTKAIFESTLRAGGNLEPLLHVIRPQPDDCLFLPSGRLHAMDAGSFFYEVQQNSNTTYRVFDWNRVDERTGQPRELHVDKALASIDFSDVEPELQQPKIERRGKTVIETLVDCPYFTLERWTTNQPQSYTPTATGSFDVTTVIAGSATLEGAGQSINLDTLGTSLIPAAVDQYSIFPTSQVTYLRTYVRPK